MTLLLIHKHGDDATRRYLETEFAGQPNVRVVEDRRGFGVRRLPRSPAQVTATSGAGRNDERRTIDRKRSLYGRTFFEERRRVVPEWPFPFVGLMAETAT